MGITRQYLSAVGEEVVERAIGSGVVAESEGGHGRRRIVDPEKEAAVGGLCLTEPGAGPVVVEREGGHRRRLGLTRRAGNRTEAAIGGPGGRQRDANALHERT